MFLDELRLLFAGFILDLCKASDEVISDENVVEEVKTEIRNSDIDSANFCGVDQLTNAIETNKTVKCISSHKCRLLPNSESQTEDGGDEGILSVFGDHIIFEFSKTLPKDDDHEIETSSNLKRQSTVDEIDQNVIYK